MLLNFGKGKNYQWASNHNFHHAGEFAIFQIYGYRQTHDLTLKNSEKKKPIKNKNKIFHVKLRQAIAEHHS